MNHIAHIIFLTTPIFLMSAGDFSGQYVLPDYNNLPHIKQQQNELEKFLPKSECNFNSSSNIASKKVTYFDYDCLQPKNEWLLISFTKANYIDVLRK